jgi:CDP-diacylglycerol--glycerol-3-phosphate 3-phosphatidyltransferase
MALTLADRITLARLLIAPAIVVSYLYLPIEHHWCFWVAGWLCAVAEYTDLLDGRIARQRGEVSDFGKLADPFCDVIYRLAVFMVLLLPAGGIGYAVAQEGGTVAFDGVIAVTTSAQHDIGQLVFAVGYDADGNAQLGAGLVPFIPVLLMAMREIIAGALRAMTAVKGLALAARSSGKLKAWVQGATLITLMAFPACFWSRASWHLDYAYWMTWLCAVLSVASICEYIWVNRAVLRQLAEHRKT